VATVGACADRSGIKKLELADPTSDWSRYGFIEIVPPILLPRNAGADDDVRVWLKLPRDSKMTVHLLQSQERDVLDYPSGTTAARVETRDGKVADVRGTRIGTDGAEFFFVYRPVGGRLEGVEWRRNDSVGQHAATEALAAMVSGTRVQAHLRDQNDCAGCHVHDRPANTTRAEHGLVNRPTDSRGFFQVQTLFGTDAPLESYKPDDPNVGAQFVDIRCADRAALLETRRGARRARCADGRVPTGHLRMEEALAQGDEHAKRVCNARGALAPYLDRAARAAFAPDLRACGLELANAEP
jgi:hypothetical protein